jgi:hypothetical protein
MTVGSLGIEIETEPIPGSGLGRRQYRRRSEGPLRPAVFALEWSGGAIRSGHSVTEGTFAKDGSGSIGVGRLLARLGELRQHTYECRGSGEVMVHSEVGTLVCCTLTASSIQPPYRGRMKPKTHTIAGTASGTSAVAPETNAQRGPG